MKIQFNFLIYKEKIEEFERARNAEIYNDFMNAFSYTNFFKCEEKDDVKNIDYEENSKNSTISQLTNDDSFERDISDEEQIIKKEFISKKRIRKNENDF